MILLHDNARSHVAKLVKDTLSYLNGKSYHTSRNCAPSDYHLFRPMQHSLADQHLKTYEETKKWLEWIEHFFLIHFTEFTYCQKVGKNY